MERSFRRSRRRRDQPHPFDFYPGEATDLPDKDGERTPAKNPTRMGRDRKLAEDAEPQQFRGNAEDTDAEGEAEGDG